MENASKALIMAGSILISVIIASMLVLMANSLTDYQQANNKALQVDAISKFNSQYEKYNKDNVRGSDIISLANKIIDYNRRKSTEGTYETITRPDGTTYTVTYEGAGIQYEPMTMKIMLVSKDYITDKIWYKKDIPYNHLFDQNITEYTADKITNTFDTKILTKVKKIEQKGYTSDALTKFVSGINKVFIGDGKGNKFDGTPYNISNENDKEEMLDAINSFNSCYGRKILNTTTDSNIKESWKVLWGNSALKDGSKKISDNVKEDVYQYYEYVLFKRANFSCTQCTPSQTTGRITTMNFKFTGEFNTGNNL